MQIAMLALAATLPLTPIADSSTMKLDVPSNAEATAAYRAVPAVAEPGGPDQHQAVDVEACMAAQGQPGVICKTRVRKDPSAAPQDVTIHFARGPDSAWVATLEQKAP